MLPPSWNSARQVDVASRKLAKPNLGLAWALRQNPLGVLAAFSEVKTGNEWPSAFWWNAAARSMQFVCMIRF
jgi:hypothetical protein